MIFLPRIKSQQQQLQQQRRSAGTTSNGTNSHRNHQRHLRRSQSSNHTLYDTTERLQSITSIPPTIDSAATSNIRLNNSNIIRQSGNNISRHSTSRPITFNERLASIGGLFGVFSIVVTGALLYAIFTAKAEDKWYYIAAVMINISLLVLLMILAILFDRFHSRSSAAAAILRQQNARQQRIRANSASARLIHALANHYHHQTRESTSSMPTEPLLNNVYTHFRVNDVPPVYPGMPSSGTPVSITKTLQRPIATADSTGSIRIKNPDDQIRSPDTAILPPNYFELYPTNEPPIQQQSNITSVETTLNETIRQSDQLPSQPNNINSTIPFRHSDDIV